jgi:hypothetical protein
VLLRRAGLGCGAPRVGSPWRLSTLCLARPAQGNRAGIAHAGVMSQLVVLVQQEGQVGRGAGQARLRAGLAGPPRRAWVGGW